MIRQTTHRVSGRPDRATASRRTGGSRATSEGLGNQTVQHALRSRRIQAKVVVGTPNDRYEREADAVADRILSAPDRDGAPPITSLGNASVQRACAACAQEEEEGRVQAKRDGARTPAARSADSAASAVRDGGAALPSTERAFFESRLGRDLSGVRIHTDAHAADAARGIGAAAYTHGAHVAFAPGRYRPGTESGRRLLAHELVHVVQQDGDRNRIHRRLVVDDEKPAAPDPMSEFSDNAAYHAAAIADMDSVVRNVCPDFSVNGSGEVVPSTPDHCNDQDTVAEGAHGGGCCCLCVMTRPAAQDWKIKLTKLGGPRTNTVDREIFLHPRDSDFEFGSFTTGNVRNLASPEVVFGHEVCGHAALIELKAHPPIPIDRLRTDIHDPTVGVENLIADEQGVPAGRLRGKAGSGSHRGESFAKVTVSKFPLNHGNIASLPSDERAKLDLAVEFAHPVRGNNTWVDLIGHSDATGPAWAKQRIARVRAQQVQQHMVRQGVSLSIVKTFTDVDTAGTDQTIMGARYTRVEGRSDSELISGAPDEQQRRVEIFMAGRPAGADTPIPATPTAVDPIGPEFPVTTLFKRFFGDACERKLIKAAWG